MESEDELKKLLLKAAEKEKRDYRRATVYVVVPVLVGIIWLAYSTRKVVNLGTEIKSLALQKETLLAENADLDQQIKIKKDSLVSAKLDFANIKDILDDPTAGSGSDKQNIKEALKVLDTAQTDVQSAIPTKERPKVAIASDPSPTPVPYSAVPDVRGLKFADAEQKARSAGLVVRRVDQPSRGTRGTVIYQDPLYGRHIPTGAQLSIYVIVWVEVPNLRGLPAADAESKIRQARLTVRNVPERGNGAAGTVLYQDPVEGKFVPPGTQVSIYVKR